MGLNWLVNTPRQLELFVYSLIFGVLLGVLYDVFRIFRLIFFKNKVAVIFQDILFWIIAGFSAFLFFLATNFGHIRIYMLLGMLIGALVYYLTIGRLVFLLVKSVCDTVKKIISFIWRHTGGALFNKIKSVFKAFRQSKKAVSKKSIKNKKTS